LFTSSDIHPNSLLSSRLELTQSTTFLQSRTKSTLSNCRLNSQSKAVCSSTAPPAYLSQIGANHYVLASTKAPSSSLRHMPKPTLLREVEKDASMLHIYLPSAGFFQTSSSCLKGRTCRVMGWLLLLGLILWAVSNLNVNVFS